MRREALALALVSAAATAGCGPGDDATLVGAPALSALIRPDTPGNNLQFNFAPGDLVESFGSTGGSFLVHFTRQGSNAVPALDVDASGTPDFVEEVAAVYDEVLAAYQGELGFRPPRGDEAIAENGGDGRFDVYLVDFGISADGHYSNDACDPGTPEICAGYMVQENDYVGYGYPSTLIANRILGSHEFFHAIQAAYDTGQGSILTEGTAVWATERFDPSLNDFEKFIDGYLDYADRSLDVPLPGPVDVFSYGSAIFFQFLEERYGDGTVRALWERCENGANGKADPLWFEELDATLTAEADASFNEAFVEFATWNLFTGSLADPSRSYTNGAGYPRVPIEDVEAPFSDDQLRVFHASTQYYGVAPNGRAAMSAALIPKEGDPESMDGLSLLLAVERGPGYDPVVTAQDLGAGTETIDTSGAERLVVVVVNHLIESPSRQPGLCIGTVDEVAACRIALIGDGSGGSGGAGAGGAGGGDGGNGGSDPAEPPPDEDTSGCGCRIVSGAPSGATSLASLALLGLAFRRRKRGSLAADTGPSRRFRCSTY